MMMPHCWIALATDTSNFDGAERTTGTINPGLDSTSLPSRLSFP